MPIWKREWYVVVGGLKVQGLRVQFTAKKTLLPDPNSLDLKVHNLAETTRARMQSRGVLVVVVAGHEGQAQVIFQGDARTVDHGRVGPDWVTHVQCGDGEKAYSAALSAFSFGPGISFQDLLAKLTGDLGINAKDALAQVRSGKFTLRMPSFPQGYAASSQTVRELDRVLKAQGIEWSIQDGSLQLVQGSMVSSESAVLLSAGTGLIGSPDHGAPEKPGMPAYLKFQAILNGGLRPGRQVKLETANKSIAGRYRCEKVQHEGDSHGPQWTTSVEALPL